MYAQNQEKRSFSLANVYHCSLGWSLTVNRFIITNIIHSVLPTYWNVRCRVPLHAPLTLLERKEILRNFVNRAQCLNSLKYSNLWINRGEMFKIGLALFSCNVKKNENEVC